MNSSLLCQLYFADNVPHYLCGIWYIYPGLWRKLIVRWLYITFPPYWVGCNVAGNCIHYPNIHEALNFALKNSRDASKYVSTNRFINVVNTIRKNVKCSICEMKIFQENQLEANYPQSQPILMNQGQFTEWVVTSAGWDQHESSWFDSGLCT